MREYRITPKRVLIVLAVVSLPILIWNWPWAILYIALSFQDKNYWTSPSCTRLIQGSVASPYGRLEAKVFHVHCDVLIGNNGFDLLALAFVNPGDDLSRYVTAMEVSLDDDDRALAPWNPDMTWKSANEIQVMLPNSVKVWIKKPPRGGVNIGVERVSDNQALRSAP